MKGITIFAGVVATLAAVAGAAPADPAATLEKHLDRRVLICDPRCVCIDKKPGELGWRSCCDAAHVFDMAEQPTTTGSPPTNTGSPQPAIEAAPVDNTFDDGDSAYEDGGDHNSTASISSSILEYRAIRGRKYHSERHESDYFLPIDERQNDSVDIAHHYLTLLFDGKLFLAPIKKDISVGEPVPSFVREEADLYQKALDIGTGTGIWAIDFADEFPNTEVTGTDLSPIQPTWVPPNVKFEIDDATTPWTWPQGTFDFVHLRYLFGSIPDWTALLREAYNACAPGGWVETVEVEVDFLSDDGTVKPDSALAVWGKMTRTAGPIMGKSFMIISENLQRKGMEDAGFVEITQVDKKCPVGGWPLDPKLAEVGRSLQLGFENDLEGYSTLVWNVVLGWPADEFQVFLMNTRKELKNPHIHPERPWPSWVAKLHASTETSHYACLDVQTFDENEWPLEIRDAGDPLVLSVKGLHMDRIVSVSDPFTMENLDDDDKLADTVLSCLRQLEEITPTATREQALVDFRHALVCGVNMHNADSERAGLGPFYAQAGDHIAISTGTMGCYVLRPEGSTPWKLIGDAYSRTLMKQAGYLERKRYGTWFDMV
ncbi:hypothetical protein OQA88_12501 [Cercophora sp. LCS_1]